MKTRIKSKFLLNILLALGIIVGAMPIIVSADAATVTVYYDFQQVSGGFANGTTYLFTNTPLTENDCVTSIPAGSALLQSTMTGNGSYDIGTKAPYYYTFSTYVTVVQGGTGFDSCPSGGLFQGGTKYFCLYGGASDVSGQSYIYKTAEISANDIHAAVNSSANINTGETTLTKANIDMTITVGGKAYTVSDYTFQDDKVNFRNHDNQITLAFGGVPITVQVDMTGMAKKMWQEDNAEIIAKTTITKGDITAIREAIEEGESNAEVTEQDLTNLRDMLKAAEFTETYDEALKLTEGSIDNYELLDEAKKAYDQLSDEEKSYIGSSVIDALNKNLNDTEELIDDSSDKFISDYVSDDAGAVYTDVTTDNIDQILSGKEDWDKLSQAEKDAINGKLTAAGSKTYEELIADAEQLAEDNSDKFIGDYVSDDAGAVYTDVTTDNIDQILSGKEDWDKLSQAEKDAINGKLTAAGSKTYEELIADAEQLAEDNSDKFIGDYVSDDAGAIYKEATVDNMDQILFGKEDWDKLSQTEKDAINEKLTAAGSKTYEELIALAEEIKEQAAQTGDDENIVLWLVLMLVSAASLVGMSVYSKKKKYSK